MLAITKQYTALFLQLLGTTFAGGETKTTVDTAVSTVESTEEKENALITLSNTTQTKQLLADLNGENLVKGSENTFVVSRLQRFLKNEGYDMGDYLNKKLFGEHAEPGIDGDFGLTTENALKAFQEKIGVPVTGEFDAATQAKLQSIVEMQEKREYKEQTAKNIQEKAKKEEAELAKSMLNETGEYNEIKTKEVITKSIQQFLMFKSELKRPQGLRGLSGDNIDSLMNLLSIDSKEFDKLVKDLKEELKTDDLSKHTFSGFFYNKVGEILQDYGYDGFSLLNAFQAGTIVRMIADTQRNRENMKNLSESDKIAVLFDFDEDGTLTSERNFDVTESQLYYLAYGTKEGDRTETFFKNIGMPKGDILELFDVNPIGTRADVALRLSLLFNDGVKPAELFEENFITPNTGDNDHENEYFTGVREATNKEKDRERSNTQKKMAASSEIMSYSTEKEGDTINVLTMDTYNISMISDSRKNPQAKIVDGKVFIGGKVESLRVEQHVQGDRVDFILVIDEGVKDKDKFFKATENHEITSAFESDTIAGTTEGKIAMLDANAIETTVQTRQYLSTMIESDALQHRDTVGMLDLQKMIFDMKTTGNTSVEQAWTQFNTVVNHKGFVKYLKEKGHAEKHADLLDGLKDAATDAEKVMILQSMMGNFMKKGHLVLNEKGETVMKNKKGENVTISQYEKENKRADFFDKIFAEEYPTLLPKIKAAREAWYAANGDKTTYTSQVVNDGGIAFTGVSSKRKGKENIHGVLPFAGVYNVAGEFVKIEGKSKEVVNSIPTARLENMKNFLNEKFGLSLTDTDAVKAFINAGGNDKVSVDYDLAFNKMGECLNDTVVLQNLTFKRAATVDVQTISEVSEAQYRFSMGANGGAGTAGTGGNSGGADGGSDGGPAADSNPGTGNAQTSTDAADTSF